MDVHSEEKWTIEIGPHRSVFNIDLRELWHYRDLLLLMVRRDFVAFYKQTILGPIWFFIQPLLTTLMYLLIFGRIAKLSTDGVPGILFYLAGVTCWTYFSESLIKTSDTFISNANIFGKVYFPRLIIPLSVVVSNLIRLGIQVILFLLIFGYYLFFTKENVRPTQALYLLPLLIILMALLSLGLGIIFSALTTKYRDLRFLLTFGIQLLMFATPVVYPLSMAPEKYKWLIIANPFTGIIETFRYAFLGSGSFSWLYLGYSCLATVVILGIGIVIFNKVEKSFIDTV
ncbi:ABC transporter permease [Pseudoflavitalea sp. X16]|uniref:ABC transporter permease n=1 Tax=Paraflavitalea devenefica TaxID=2716334 RepID=UPI00141E7905|nr:ABC transporter permease [Paraflavitalea devenefica]NII24100.1 ABC transporter permease [Paraflavitalea devenefica]